MYFQTLEKLFDNQRTFLQEQFVKQNALVGECLSMLKTLEKRPENGKQLNKSKNEIHVPAYIKVFHFLYRQTEIKAEIEQEAIRAKQEATQRKAEAEQEVTRTIDEAANLKARIEQEEDNINAKK